MERVNEFLRLNSHVKFSSNKVEVLVASICHVKYWSVTEIVACIFLTLNQMIFLVQFGINKHSQIFQRLQIALALRARAIFCSLWKICLCLFIPNYTRNHLITYTNCTPLGPITITNHTVSQAARAILAFWKTHSCKLIPNRTQNRMISYTNKIRDTYEYKVHSGGFIEVIFGHTRSIWSYITHNNSILKRFKALLTVPDSVFWNFQ